MRRAKLLALALVVTASCASHPGAEPRWRRQDVVGLHLFRADPRTPGAEEEYWFGDGYVDVTGRRTTEVDGVAKTVSLSPEYPWKLRDGRVFIGYDKNAWSWTLVSRDAATLVIRTEGGEVQSFQIREPLPPARR